jgi:hypothetical protein
MSHRDDCPDRWQAEREGRHDARRRSSVDYDHFDCSEAQYDYERAFRSERGRMRREEEEREENEAAMRAEERRCAEEAAYEEALCSETDEELPF